jgi:DNA-directed RNA polymerase specialized sigma24 family protein
MGYQSAQASTGALDSSGEVLYATPSNPGGGDTSEPHRRVGTVDCGARCAARRSCWRPVHAGHPELRLDLASAIQSLPEEPRQAIFLRDFEEFSIDEIADNLLLTR